MNNVKDTVSKHFDVPVLYIEETRLLSWRIFRDSGQDALYILRALGEGTDALP